jgi:prepilin-type N-terminal cleavage/methylation domain-containing protein
MSKIGFSLIELILVIVLMGVVSFLSVSLPSATKNLKSLENLTQYKNIEINLSNFCENFTIYQYDGNFKDSEKINYIRKNGIGETFILECNSKFYIFKPFKIEKVSSFEDGKDKFLNNLYSPDKGML